MDCGSRRPICSAVESNNAVAIKWFYQHAVPIIDSNDYLMHEAAYNNADSAITALLSSGAEINRKSTEGNTPLHSACEYNQHRAIKCLLQHGAKRKMRNNETKLPHQFENCDQTTKNLILM